MALSLDRDRLHSAVACLHLLERRSRQQLRIGASYGKQRYRGKRVEAYDQMIGEGNKKGNAVVQAAIDGLVDQTKSIERVIAALDLGTVKLEGSASLDNPSSVFK